jgi:Tol biopolymer transport system component/tRNA A-37 threonylcarbamoyl transferase component Bud32
MSQLDPEQWAEVRRLFERAGALRPAQRASFLEKECLDEDVRREVRALLERPATAIDGVAEAIAAEMEAIAHEPDPDEHLIGMRLGPYNVDAIVGHGGMGAVYRASRADGEFRHQVAVKLVRAAARSPAALQRFKQERQILAHLSHPNIARLLDGGSTQDGVPYLVMEFIAGEPLTASCARQSLSLNQRLRLFLQVCEGVEFAHQNRVVHRDLKPGNILVTADGAPKLLDFGVAKMLASDRGEAAATTADARFMTLDYAAPEQVRGDAVSKAVDVYALGLILYELLTGRKAQEIPDPSPATVARIICQTDPVSPAALQPVLAGDLDNIIRKAIRKEPQRRYASVADLAHDIELHLRGRPVTARPDTLSYRTAKFMRRNRAAIAAVLVTAILFCGAVWAYRLGAPRSPRALGVTQLTQTGHVAGNGLVTDGNYLYCVLRAPGQYTLARVPIGGGTPEPLEIHLHNTDILDISHDRSRLLVSNGIGLDVPLWEIPTATLVPRRIGDALGHDGAWSPDGKSIVFARGSSLFQVNSDGSGLHKLLDTTGTPGTVRWAAASGAGIVRFCIEPSGGGGVGHTLWEIGADGTHLRPMLPNHGSGPGSATAIDDGGGWLAGDMYYLYRSVRGPMHTIWIKPENRRFPGLFAQPSSPIHSTTSGVFWLAPDRHGKRVFFISGQERRQFVRYDAARREFVPFLPGTTGRWASFSRDGRWIAYTIAPQEALWRCRPDGSQAVQLSSPSLRVQEPSWSPDGATVLFSAHQPDGRYGVYVVPLSGGVPERITSGDSSDGHVSWSPDGRSVLFSHAPRQGEAGRGLCVMDWKTRKSNLLPESERWTQGAWSPDGRHIVATNGAEIEIFDILTRQWTPLTAIVGTGPPVWSRNGEYVYYQNLFEAEQPIYRARIDGGKIERVASSRQIPQSDITLFVLAGLAPDDAPIAAVVRKNADIYALDLDLP